MQMGDKINKKLKKVVDEENKQCRSSKSTLNDGDDKIIFKLSY